MDAKIKHETISGEYIYLPAGKFRVCLRHKSKHHSLRSIPVYDNKEEAEAEAQRLASGAAYHLKAVIVQETI